MKTSLPISHAIHVLADVLTFQRPADAVLSYFFRHHHEVGARDRDFIAETVYAILRRKRLLDHVAPGATPRKLALAALVKLQGVSLRELEPLLKGSEDEWLKAMKAVPTDDLTPAEQADLPDWLWQRLAAEQGEERALALGRAMQQPAPLDLRVNTLLASRDEVLAAFRGEGIEAEATPYSPVGIRLKKKTALNRHPLFLAGKVEVQDEGSQLLALLLAPKRRDMVVDFCAGAGGKTLLLGALMASQGRLYAFDISDKRLNQLKPRLKRSGLSNVHPQLISGENDARIKRLAGKADRVLVDAPCSGLGTLRRNPDLKWRQTPESVTELTAKQAAILASAARLVKNGGRLVYATCSLLREENEGIVEAFLAAHPDFRLASAAQALAEARVALDTGDYLKLQPQTHGTDGFFAAVMERAD
ncbi:MAG: RsmB/NOP family class I SAM-dependent RNA methyltransferase [Sulfuricellaceae bacterium]|jgi:16S rRNA (cytosine967-C5)-methyltransferase